MSKIAFIRYCSKLTQENYLTFYRLYLFGVMVVGNTILYFNLPAEDSEKLDMEESKTSDAAQVRGYI